MNTSQETLPQDGRGINWHNIKFSPYEFKDILAFDLTQEMNEHARLYISGIVHEMATNQPANRDYVQTTDQYSPVSLTYTDQNGKAHCLFQGVVTNIKQRIRAGLTYLDIEALSFSYLLDIKKISRSFQREGESYGYIFQRINRLAREYVPALQDDVVRAEGDEDQQITSRLIIQYQETDWMFLKRLASHFNLALTPDITFTSPKIYFGLPPAPSREYENQNGFASGKHSTQGETGPQFKASAYQIKRSTTAYAIASSNNRKNSGVSFSENDFTYCEAESLDVLKLGQPVTFQGLSWYIKSMHTHMDKGTVKNTYILATKKGLMEDDRYNENLPGISLHGIVKSIAKDQVKVHITDIDGEWDSGATWWFPYATVYSSPDGSGFYCMPEIGDNVRINFPNKQEAQSIAISSVNMTPSKRGKREDPNTKILSTVHGKQIILTPGGIQIISNGNLLMTLTDEGGVAIKSDKNIKLQAKKNIEIVSTTSKVTVLGQDEVNLSQGGGQISIKDAIVISGQKVKMQS